MTNNKYITAVKWAYGFNNTEAKNFIREAKENNNAELLEELVNEYNENAKKSFWND